MFVIESATKKSPGTLAVVSLVFKLFADEEFERIFEIFERIEHLSIWGNNLKTRDTTTKFLETFL